MLMERTYLRRSSVKRWLATEPGFVITTVSDPSLGATPELNRKASRTQPGAGESTQLMRDTKVGR